MHGHLNGRHTLDSLNPERVSTSSSSFSAGASASRPPGREPGSTVAFAGGLNPSPSILHPVGNAGLLVKQRRASLTIPSAAASSGGDDHLSQADIMQRIGRWGDVKR